MVISSASTLDTGNQGESQIKNVVPMKTKDEDAIPSLIKPWVC